MENKLIKENSLESIIFEGNLPGILDLNSKELKNKINSKNFVSKLLFLIDSTNKISELYLLGLIAVASLSNSFSYNFNYWRSKNVVLSLNKICKFTNGSCLCLKLANFIIIIYNDFISEENIYNELFTEVFKGDKKRILGFF